ncbi:hypothetical protein [Pandoraea communis]|uniref:hypothetical protein n=1 Tax=Pandoraea communis TaxID=2508297 RepID=UPI0025A61B27|nr:hypothetical protein [Pandoraea communis]MDM8356162.1 hypothetical protein [Pandoraea communis]
MATNFQVQYYFTLDDGKRVNGKETVEAPDIRMVYKIAEAVALHRYGYPKESFHLSAIIELE